MKEVKINLNALKLEIPEKGISGEAEAVLAESVLYRLDNGDEYVLTKNEIKANGGSFYDIRDTLSLYAEYKRGAFYAVSYEYGDEEFLTISEEARGSYREGLSEDEYSLDVIDWDIVSE